MASFIKYRNSVKTIEKSQLSLQTKLYFEDEDINETVQQFYTLKIFVKFYFFEMRSKVI